MSYPGIIRRLFENDGAGDKLNPDILPFGDGKERDPAKTPATLADLSSVEILIRDEMRADAALALAQPPQPKPRPTQPRARPTANGQRSMPVRQSPG